MTDSREYTIAIDTREQAPYKFDGSERATLKTGDYSIVGLEGLVAVERKSKSDMFGTAGGGRDRFVRELARMRLIPFSAIVVESTLRSMLTRPQHVMKMSPKAVINSLLSWQVRFGVAVVFSGDRALGRATVLRLLDKAWRHRELLAWELEHIVPTYKTVPAELLGAARPKRRKKT